MNKSALLPKMKEKAAKVWGAMVFCRDRWCMLCGREDALQPHHWIVTAARSLRGRYDERNGVLLCYACHLRKVHPRADFASINDIRLAVGMQLERVVELQKEFEVENTLTSVQMYDELDAFIKQNQDQVRRMNRIKAELKIKNTCTGCGKLKRKCICEKEKGIAGVEGSAPF